FLVKSIIIMGKFNKNILNKTQEELSNHSQDLNINSENMTSVSEHVPKHLKPANDTEFGHYLAGLIDGNGTFSKYCASIAFSELDASLAYYIKGRLGYGKIRKLELKKAFILTITKREGLEKLLNLINGKIRTQFKYDSIYKHILNAYQNPLVLKENFHLNMSKDLDNHWLAGFIDSLGNFQINTLTPNTNGGTRFEVRLSLQIDQKKRILLDLIKDKLGGNIAYRNNQDTYYYSSTSFGSAKNVITYLNKYHLLSSKYLNYLKWRKVYILLQNKKHLTIEGQKKIIKFKTSMNTYTCT
uniref:hypothetical protein n=1 Tax=Perenniporia fraxinea TaxID=1350006 RepID=UPI0028E0A436